jgi:hypothetical protein
MPSLLDSIKTKLRVWLSIPETENTFDRAGVIILTIPRSAAEGDLTRETPPMLWRRSGVTRVGGRLEFW